MQPALCAVVMLASASLGHGYVVMCARFSVLTLKCAAFLEFEDERDAADAVRKLDGFKGWVSGWMNEWRVHSGTSLNPVCCIKNTQAI
jgi:hypothetical protein